MELNFFVDPFFKGAPLLWPLLPCLLLVLALVIERRWRLLTVLGEEEAGAIALLRQGSGVLMALTVLAGPTGVVAQSATPQAPNRPPLIGGPTMVSVWFAENDTSVVGTFTATDPDGDASAFTLGASSGVLQFASTPNYEASADTDADNVYGVWVIAQDDGTPSQADSVSVAVTVADEDDLGTLTLSSSSPQVGMAVTATLADEDGPVSKVRWTWQRRVDASADWVDIPSSGADSYTPVRADVGYQLRAKVKYNDYWGTDKKVTKKAPQQVAGVPGPPALSAEPGDGQVGLRWTAPASDGGRSITGYEYWYSGVGDHAWTPVDGGTSADNLTVSRLTNGQEYTFAVRAVNKLGAGLADSTQATPQASNRPPSIGGPASVSVSFAENDTVQVSTFTATDPDGDGIAWVLAGDDASAFTLGASSGVLQFASAPNYEASADTDADNVYGVWVIAQDDGTPSQADSVSVAVTVSDEDDLGTLTLSSSSPQVGVAMTATLTDEDEPVSKIRWTWQRRVDASADWVDIPSSGAVSYTPVRADVGYQLRAKVKYNDPWGKDKKVTKKAPQQVVGVPGPPALSAEPGDGQVGLRWTAPASDGGRSITGYEYWYSGVGDNAWSLVDGGASADNLTISSLTNGQEYTFAVRAVNKLGAGLADSTQAMPQASNRPPLIGGPASVSVSFAENDTSAVSTFTATDPEGDGIAWVLAGDDAGAFTLGVSSGVLQFASAPNYEAPSDTDADNVYGVWVIAQDDGTPSEADSVAVAVIVTDGDDLGTLTLTLSSSSPQVGMAMTATLTDEDGPVSKVRWTWQRRVDASADWVDIPSSSAASYTPVRADVGYQLRAKVKYDDRWGTDKKVTQKAPQQVVDVPGPPVLSAEPGDGQVALRWTAPASDGGRSITGYEYWYSGVGDNAWSSVDGGASADNLTVRSLTNGQEYTFAVRAVNELGAGLADSTQATPQASNRPPLIGGPASVSVSFVENDTVQVSTFTATDPDGDTIAWVLAGDDAEAFTLGASSGVLQFAATPNYEVPSDTDADNVYGVWVIAQDDGTPSEADSVSVAVTVADGDDLGTLTLTLSSSGPQVGVAMTATLADEDGQVSKVRWTWQRRVDASVDWADIPSSGAASYTPVRADVGYQLRAKVKYDDRWGADKKVTQKAPQQVVDVPGPPVLSAEPGDGQVGLRWTAPASDGGRPITGYEYWHSGVGDNAWSSVDGGASADNLTVRSLTNGQEYTFAVRAVNKLGAGLADSTQATPQASNRPPSIGGPASVSVSFAENDTSAVSTFTATDPEGDGIAWVLAGDDAGAFTLGVSSGVLQFASAPNYEAPSDTDADNVYGVWVIAQDDGTPSEADSVAVAVTVTDGDDLGTLTLTLSSSGPQVGVAMTATLADEDGQVSKIRWTWQRRVDASADWVDIPSSGADSYTPVRADVGYQLRARVKYNDRWGEDKKVTQKAPQQVVDVPGPPVLSAEPGDGQVELRWTVPASDGGRSITGYEYWYSDAGDNAWSSVDGGASADSLTVLGLTNGQEYTFAVRAVNELGVGLADSTQATPQMPNHPPSIGGPASVAVSFVENDTGAVSTFTATDPDGDGIAWVLAGGDASAFSIGASSGVLQFASAPNYEAPSDTDADNVYGVWVIAQDDGTPSQADSVSVAVTVTAVDEPGTLTLSSSSPQEGVPLTVSLHDEDGLLSVQFTKFGMYYSGAGTEVNLGAPVSTNSGAIGPDTAYVFIPTAEWVGFRLKVKATYTDPHGAKTQSTPWTEPVVGTTVEDTGTVSLSSMSPQVWVPLTATLTDSSGGIFSKEWTWQRRSGSSATWADIPASSDSSYTPGSGDAGYQLRATVRYRDAHGGALDSAQSAATAGVQANVPCAPELSAKLGDAEVALSWTVSASCDGGSSITHYQYQPSAGSWTDVPGDGSKREHVVSNLTNGTLYTFAVRAVNAVGAGAASNDASATPEAGGTVSLTSTSPRVGVALTATLTDPDGQVTGVHWTWQRRPASWFSRWVDISSSNAASYTPVVGDVGYQLRATVSYRDGQGNNQDSAQSAATSAVQANVPSAPRNLRASAQSSSQIRLTWDAPLSNGGATITGYQYRRQRQGGSWTVWSNVSGGGSARSYTVSSLSSSTSYTFQVRAVNKVGNGASAQATGTTQAPPPSPPPVPVPICNAPSNLRAETVGLGYFDIKLTWEPPSPNCNPTLYQYRQRPQRGTWRGPWTAWSTVSSPYTASGLDSGTRYTFEVRARNAGGTGKTASIISDTRAKLVAPSLLAAPDSVLAAISAPNPFNPSTTLHVQLPTSGPVSLILYNLSGQVVRTAWVEHYLEAGVHLWQWDGQDDQGRPVASGVYLYVLRASDQTLMQKVTLLR